MGCLFCPKKKTNPIGTSEIDSKPLIIDVGEPAPKPSFYEAKNDFDEPKAKQLVTQLLNSDQFYGYLLKEVLNLSSEEFRRLFEGDSDFNYPISNENYRKKFTELATKFENYSIVLITWYKKGNDYYECLKDIWKGFNYLYEWNNLDEMELEKKLDGISKKWTKEIREDFKDKIRQSKDLSNKLDIFLKEDEYKDLGNVVKEMMKSQKIFKKTENKNIKIDKSYEKIMENILENTIPIFLDKLNSDYEKNKIPKLTDNQKNNIIKTFLKKYELSDLGEINTGNSLETIKNLLEKINYSKVFSSDTKNQIVAASKNKVFPHVILGLNFMNLCSNIYYTYKLFENSDKTIKYLKDKLDEIKNDFNIHKNQIKLIDPKKNGYEQSMRDIEEIGKKFEEDKMAVKQLIDEINSALEEQKTEKKNRIYQLVFDGIKTLASGGAAIFSKEKNKKIEFGVAGIFSGISVANDVLDVKKIQSNIKEFIQILNEAETLENQIKAEIEKLNQKYLNVQKGRLPDIFR